MSQKYVYEDEVYIYRNGTWYTQRGIKAPLYVISKLNKMLLNDTDLDEKNLDELTDLIDSARKTDNYQLAAKSLESALRKTTKPSEIRNLLPRLTSNYRKLGKPHPAIDLAQSYLNEYGKRVWSPALFTSVSAAYCDIDDFETARKFANLARSISGANSSPELISVYQRIKQNTL